MAIVKVIEILAEAETSFDDAVRAACAEASKSVRNIQNIYVKDMQAIVEDNQIVRYRVNAKVSFLVDAGQIRSS